MPVEVAICDRVGSEGVLDKADQHLLGGLTLPYVAQNDRHVGIEVQGRGSGVFP